MWCWWSCEHVHVLMYMFVLMMSDKRTSGRCCHRATRQLCRCCSTLFTAARRTLWQRRTSGSAVRGLVQASVTRAVRRPPSSVVVCRLSSRRVWYKHCWIWEVPAPHPSPPTHVVYERYQTFPGLKISKNVVLTQAPPWTTLGSLQLSLPSLLVGLGAAFWRAWVGRSRKDRRGRTSKMRIDGNNYWERIGNGDGWERKKE